MSNYDEMSDYDINREVAIFLGIDVPSESNPWLWKTEFCLHQLNGDGSKIEKTIVANYCNDPSLAWPIILKYGITIEFDDSANFQNAYICHEEGYPEFEHGFDTDDCNKNPLRAAMICFLKMKNAEK